MIVTITAATALPVTLADAIEHCRAPDDGSDDAAVDRALRAATAYVADASGRVLAPTTLQQQLCSWPPCGGIILLSSAPVRDVTSVSYLDEDDAEQTAAGSEWSWARTPSGAVVKFGSTWSAPALSELPWPVRVTFDAGYDDPATSGSGDDPDLVLPYQARVAVLMLTAYWYDTREAVVSPTGNDPKAIPLGVDALLGQLKVYR